MADVLRKENKLAEARSLYEEALQVVERVLGPDHVEVSKKQGPFRSINQRRLFVQGCRVLQCFGHAAKEGRRLCKRQDQL